MTFGWVVTIGVVLLVAFVVLALLEMHLSVHPAVKSAMRIDPSWYEPLTERDPQLWLIPGRKVDVYDWATDDEFCALVEGIHEMSAGE